MKVYRGLEHLRLRRPLCLAVGIFDGLHLGHQQILATAVAVARRKGLRSAVLTFDPHPDSVLRPEEAQARLTTLAEKLSLIASLGVRVAVVAEFADSLASTPAEDFVREVLREKLRAGCVVVGRDWRFGAGGVGSADLLQSLAGGLGMGVHVVPPITFGRAKISSTRIRRLLSTGRVGAARELLGRRYRLAGRVRQGLGRGRGLGFPTANLAPPAEKLIPARGVYAGWAGLRRLRPAVLNIGVRPTFEREGEVAIEVHLLDSRPPAPLLGKRLQVLFEERLRGERRFPSPEALVRQMERDRRRSRGLLAALQPPRNVLLSGGSG